jgi:hypothetical protein
MKKIQRFSNPEHLRRKKLFRNSTQDILRWTEMAGQADYYSTMYNK